MFEQCTSHVATATQATLERRPDATEGSTAISQEAPAAIPEGTPPSPSQTVASWLEQAKLSSYLAAVQEEGYEELEFLRAAEEEDIQAFVDGLVCIAVARSDPNSPC